MSTTLDLSLKVLYVQGLAADVDRGTTDQLRAASPELQITTIAGSAAALAELRRTPGWQALFASPSLPQNEILALIASLRRDRVPIAIVPIVDDAHQDLFASAVASGADDVLVRRAGSLVNINETLTRIRQSPHLFPAEQRRRISVLYAGRDPLVWNLLDQVPFVKADRVATSIDGTCSVRRPGAGDDSLRTDAVIIDETPGDAHPLQVLKSVKAQASDLPVIMLTSAGAADIATAALELGADDTVLKTGIFRRRLIATLRRVHQRIELNAQQTETRTREERLRQIVENVPTGIMVVAADGRVLAMNAAALHLFGAGKPRDIVGRDLRELVEAVHRDSVTNLIRTVTKGEAGSVSFDALTLGGARLKAHIDAVVLERDARGGRGLVASITRADQRVVDGTADGKTEELAALRDTLERLERHYAELEDARTNERAAWESERQRLETRLEAAERLAAERATLQERLDDVTAELGRTSESFAAERQALQGRLQELEAAAHEAATAGAANASLEGSLLAVREELREAIEGHARERSGWQEIRTELETRVQQLDTAHRSEHDALVATLQLDVRRLEQELADQGARWDVTRRELELELRNAREALWAEHSERDAARATSDAQLAELQTSVEQERASWRTAQTTLEQELAHARDNIGTTQSEWERSRADLERSLQDTRLTLDAERASREADRDAYNRATQELESAHEGERWQWIQQQHAFEVERRSFVDRGIVDSNLDAERTRLEGELATTRQQWDQERQAADLALQQARQDVTRLEDDHRRLTDEFDSARVRLEQERDQVRVAADAEWRDRLADVEARLEEATRRAAESDAAHHQARQDASETQEQRDRDWQTTQTEWQQRLNTLETALTDAATRASQLESDWINERADLRQAAEAVRTEADQERGHLVSLHVREVEEWRQAVDRARAERDAATERVAVIEGQLDEAHRQLGELETLRGALESAHGDRDDAQRRVSDIEQTLADTQQKLTELEALQPALEAARHERDDLQHRVDALTHDLERAHQQHAETQATLQTTQEAFDAARGDRDAAYQRVTALEQTLAHAQQQLGELDTLRGDVDTARRERDEARQHIDALEHELGAARVQVASLEALRSDLDAARGDRDAAYQRVSALEQTLADAQQQVGEIDTLRGDVDTARRERDETRQRLDAVEPELAAAQAQLVSFEALQRDLDAARQRTTELEEQLAHARNHLASLEALPPQLAAAQQEQQDARQWAESLERELGAARDQVVANQYAAEALEAARSEIRHTDAAHHAERERWLADRQALEHQLREAQVLRVSESERWSLARTQFERESARLADEHQSLLATVATLRHDCASLKAEASSAHETRERDRNDLDELKALYAQTEHKSAELTALLDQAARSAEEQLAIQQARHESRLHELDAEIRQLTARLSRASHEADLARAELSESFQQAADSHARLLESDAFGYAVTTRTGELVKCNDAFGRMFGYTSASDVLRRNTGRPFKPVSGRPDVDARLNTAGRVDRYASCMERIDGQAINVQETAVLLDPTHVSESLVEHIMVAGPAGPTDDELKGRRLQEVGALTTAMVPELESLTSSVHDLSLERHRTTTSDSTGNDGDERLRVISGQVATLVRQLAAFSRRQLRRSEPLDLGAVVAAAQPMLSRLVGDYISFNTEPGTAPTINAQRDDVEQLLTSLVTTGRDLLPAGGTITVHVRHDDAVAGPGGSGVAGTMLAVHASGYGVQSPSSSTALELIAQRCGGTIRVSGERGWLVRLEAVFPRCGSTNRPGWDWLTE